MAGLGMVLHGSVLYVIVLSLRRRLPRFVRTTGRQVSGQFQQPLSQPHTLGAAIITCALAGKGFTGIIPCVTTAGFGLSPAKIGLAVRGSLDCIV